MPEEGLLPSLEDALMASMTEADADTLAEMGLEAPQAPPVGDVAPEPADVDDSPEQADSTSSEGSEHPTDGEQGGFGELLDQLEEQASQTPSTPALTDETVITFSTPEGQQSVSVGELKNGYLRQADYTQKTQELAAQRKGIGEAADFYAAFREDPAGFAKYIASKAGLIDGSVPTPQGVSLLTESEVEARAQAMAQTLVKDHPLVKEAEQTVLVNRIDQAFRGLESRYDVTLNDNHRKAILLEAQRRQTGDINTVFLAMLQEAALAKQAKPKVASPAKPERLPAEEVVEEPMVENVGQALERALQELGM